MTVIGMPSTPTAPDALKRLMIKISSGSVIQRGVKALAHTLSGRGPASVKSVSIAVYNVSAATRAPTPAKY